MPNYTLSDSETVKNKLGALSHDELEAKEVAWVSGRQVERSLNPQIPRTFDAAHLKAIHRHLFQDVYEWAGRTRDEQVRLSDGTIASEPLLYRPGSKPFAVGPQISGGLDALAAKLRDADHLRGLPRAQFAGRAASVLAEANSIHPFREGNGRTQRIFLQELAESAGHSFEFRVVSRERMIQASIAAHEDRDIGPMKRMLDEISNPHRVAALTPAIAFLNSAKYPWNDRYVATLAWSRRRPDRRRSERRPFPGAHGFNDLDRSAFGPSISRYRKRSAREGVSLPMARFGRQFCACSSAWAIDRPIAPGRRFIGRPHRQFEWSTAITMMVLRSNSPWFGKSSIVRFERGNSGRKVGKSCPGWQIKIYRRSSRSRSSGRPKAFWAGSR